MPPVIDQNKCLGCEECAAMEDCPQGVFIICDEPYTVIDDPEDCINCGICVDSCNGGAITIDK